MEAVPEMRRMNKGSFYRHRALAPQTTSSSRAVYLWQHASVAGPPSLPPFLPSSLNLASLSSSVNLVSQLIVPRETGTVDTEGGWGGAEGGGGRGSRGVSVDATFRAASRYGEFPHTQCDLSEQAP